MNQFGTSVLFLSAVLCSSCAPASQSGSPAKAAAALNAQSKATLGVSVRSLAFLFDTDPGTYHTKDSVALQNSWQSLMALEKSGYVKVTTIPSADGEFVQIILTPKGEEVVSELRGP